MLSISEMAETIERGSSPPELEREILSVLGLGLWPSELDHPPISGWCSDAGTVERVALEVWPNGRGAIAQYEHHCLALFYPSPGDKHFEGRAALPGLAMMAAVLRARAAEPVLMKEFAEYYRR